MEIIAHYTWYSRHTVQWCVAYVPVRTKEMNVTGDLETGYRLAIRFENRLDKIGKDFGIEESQLLR